MKIGFWILGILLTIQSTAQEHFTITGKIIDVETKEPLSFATISIQNTAKGVVANEEGQFDLIVSLKDSIMISVLGYDPLTEKVEHIAKSGQTIFGLNARPVLLDEVIVSEENKKLSGEEILKQVIKSQKANFPDSNHALSIFFRETNQINDEYFKLVEAASTIYGNKYPNKSKKVFIDQIRTANNLKVSVPIATEGNYNPFREFQGLIGSVSNVRACKKCKYQVEEYLTYEGHLAAIIISTNNNETHPRIFRYTIDLETFAVIRSEFESKIPFGIGFPTMHEGYESSLIYLKRTFEYKPHNGRYFLQRYHQKGIHHYSSMADSLESYQTTHDFHVVTNQVQTSVEPPGKNENLMSYKDEISEMQKNYDPEFWKYYNMLKQTPLDKKIIEDLKNKSSLENLFTEKEKP